ncbi:MAG: hypothetical protein IMZ62_18505 [Chloroflexi bacterium]|nr:hypothetical protein [Chloroflexota bacterium]
MNRTIFIIALALPILVGCLGGHEFQLQAPTAIVAASVELDKGIAEYHTAEGKFLDAAEKKSRDELKTDLAIYVLKVGAAAGKGTLEEAKAAITPAFDAFDKSMVGITSDRTTERTRYTNMLTLTEWVRKLSAQMAEIETLRYATSDQLRQMAAEAVRTNLTPKGTK